MDGFSNRNIQLRRQSVPRSSSRWFWLILIFGVCAFCLPNLLSAEEDGEADVPNVDSVPVESIQPIEREGILAEENGEADVPNVDLFQVEGTQPIEREGILAVGDGEEDVSYIDSLQVEGNQRIEKEF